MSRRRVDPDVARAIEEDLVAGYSPSRVLDRLQADDQLRDRAPSLRTIESIAAEIRPRSSSTTWSLAAAEPAAAALVLPVLAELARRSEGRLVSLAADTAEWVVRIRRAAPALEPYAAFRWAVRYQLSAARGQDTAALDVELAVETQQHPRPE